MLSASQSKVTVLVVDDDAIARGLLAQFLQMSGFEVIAAPNGERALLKLCQQGEEIDWLVSKVSLPGLVCGRILQDEYRRLHPDRPALLIAALDPSQRQSAHTVFVPPASPVRVLEILQALRTANAAPIRPFASSRAA